MSVNGAIMGLVLISSAFTNNGNIPSKFTCEGQDISPQLSWSNVPANAKSLVLIVDDPDAPDPRAPKMTWVHWLLYNIPVTAKSLPEGVTSANLPKGTLEGISSWNKLGYGGPCPPIGAHRYFHKLFALDIVLQDLKSPTKDALLRAMEGHVIAKTELIGLYKKQHP